MKKNIFCALLFLISFSFVFAQTMTDEELDSAIENVLSDTVHIKETVNSYVETNFFANEQFITDLSLELPVDDRLAILESNYMEKKKYILPNLWPGFGVGSFRQKDYLSFGILCGLDIIGDAAIIGGTAWFFVDLIIAVFVSPFSQSNNAELDRLFTGAFITLGSGAAIALSSRILGWVLASNFSEKYNLRLQKALQLDNNDELALSPVIDPIGKKYGITASIKL